ncbi:hypothetical protein BASA81_003230 [Batrachochytrium salamandrivorans]|nr:hypothetical protein BASA81_003230 [Batrachochytrium salamandrivorans]
MDAAATREKLDAAEALAQRRLEDNENLKQELRSVRSKLVSTSSQLRSQSLTLDQSQAQQQVAAIESERYKQENALLRERIKFAESEAMEEASALRLGKQEATKRAAQSDALVAKLQAEKFSLESQFARSVQEQGSLQRQCDLYQEEVKTLRLEAAEQDQAGELESQANSKLIAHYKVLEQENRTEREVLVAKIQDLAELVTTREEEIESMKRNPPLLSTVSEAANEQSLKQRGLTLSVVYSQYVEQVERNKELERRDKEHGVQMQQILTEVEHTVPELTLAKSRYVAAVMANEEANSKFTEAFNDNARLRTQCQQLQQDQKLLKRENQELELQAQDLASQVQSLLGASASTVASPGGLLRTPGRSIRHGNDAQEVISESLVDFASIKELQQRNQELLRVIRRLNEQDEEVNQEQNGKPHAELQQELDQALDQLEKMSENRARQELMVQEICRQRDLLRDLLMESTSQVAPLTAPAADLTVLRREAELTIASLEASKTELLVQLRDCKFHTIQLESEKEFESKRVQHVEHMYQQEQRETKRLQTNVAESSQLVIQSQSLLAQRGEELQQAQRQERTLQQRVTEFESQIKLLDQELAFIKSTNASLTEQRDSFSKLQKSLTNQVESLQRETETCREQATQADMELTKCQQEYEGKMRTLQTQVTKLEQAESQLGKDALQSKQLVLQRDEEIVKLKQEQQSTQQELTKLVGMRYADATSESLLGRLEDRDRQLAGFKQISETHEETIRLLELKTQTLEKRVAELEQERTEWLAKNSKLETELKAAVDASNQTKDKLEETTSALEQRGQQVTMLEKQVAELEANLEQAEQSVDTKQDNYAKLLQIHAKEMETRRGMEADAKLVGNLQIQLEDAKQAVQAKQNELDTHKRQAESQLKDRQLEIQDLQRENRLHLERMPITAGAMADGGENAQQFDTAQLLQVCTNQRNRLALEKEQLEVEANRTGIQLTQSRRELQALKEELASAQSHASSSSSLQDQSQEVQVLKGLNNLLVQNEAQLKLAVTNKQKELDETRQMLEKRVGEFTHAKSRAQHAEEESQRKEHEVKLLQQRLQGMMARIGNAQAADELRVELDQSKQELQAQQELRAQTEQTLQDERSKLAAAQTEIDKSKVLTERFRKKIAEDSKARTELSDRLEKSAQEVKTKQTEMEALGSEVKRLKAEAAIKTATVTPPPVAAAPPMEQPKSLVAVAMDKAKAEKQRVSNAAETATTTAVVSNEEDTALTKKPTVEEEDGEAAKKQQAAAALKKAADAAADAALKEAADAALKKEEAAAARKKAVLEEVALKKKQAAEAMALKRKQDDATAAASSSAAIVEEGEVATPTAAAPKRQRMEEEPTTLSTEMAQLFEPVNSLRLGKKLVVALGVKIAFKSVEELKLKLASHPLLATPQGMEQVKQILASEEFLQEEATKAQLAERIKRLEQNKSAASTAAATSTSTTPSEQSQPTSTEEQAARERRANRFGQPPEN